ncbi:3'-5' exonuclease [uncultured Maribacter sp.]|uniref:3'-5' exonuclease n=1 Tax=uncultured Maribacter sp. TaxID=431308 RepID=UPI00262BE4EA|nr:3'-5' exonuclease [uncultured Maribacter sp.]
MWFKSKKKYPEYWNRYESLFKEETPQDISKIRFVVFDTETTGFSVISDRILCIGALSLENNKIQVHNSFEVYVKQNVYKEESAKIHGILNNSKKNLISEEESVIQFLAYLGNAVIIAHHAMFDINMFNQALGRLGLPELKNKYLDTSTLYKKTQLKSNLLKKQDFYTLDELTDKFDISKEDRHTALGDAYITAIAFLKILTELKKKKTVTLKVLLK